MAQPPRAPAYLAGRSPAGKDLNPSDELHARSTTGHHPPWRPPTIALGQGAPTSSPVYDRGVLKKPPWSSTSSPQSDASPKTDREICFSLRVSRRPRGIMPRHTVILLFQMFGSHRADGWLFACADVSATGGADGVKHFCLACPGASGLQQSEVLTAAKQKTPLFCVFSFTSR